MTVRVVEWKKPYTWGKAIEITDDKVINLRLREDNNLIIYDEWDNKIYVDLQLPDEITPTDAFPVWVTTGRVIVDNWWDLAWTIICAKTTSGDNIKLLYADEGTLWIDNWTWSFKQIYFKSDVDALLSALRDYIDWELSKKQNWVTSDTAPENPSEWDLWYDTVNSELKVYDGSQWVATWTGGWLPSWWTAGQMLAMSSNWPVWVDVASPTSITLDTSSIGFSNVWDTYQLSATVSPSSAIITQLYWSSSDETIATVDSTWLVTCVSLWTATITATTINWVTATCGVVENTWQWDMDNWALAQTSESLSWNRWWWVFMNPDGTKLYLSHNWGKRVYEIPLSTAYDISGTLDFSKYISAGYSSRWPEDVHFSTDGTKMFIISENGTWVTLVRYSLSTAWDISTATQDQTLAWVWTSAGRWLYITPDWTKAFVTNHNVTTYSIITMSTPYDLTTATITSSDSSMWWLSIWFGNDWEFVAWQWSESVSYLDYADVTTAYDLSTMTNSWTKTIWSCRAWWLWFSNNWTICMMVWWWGGANYVTKYTL